MNKPKIALVVEVYNWAFYNNAVIIKEKLSEYYDIKIIPSTTVLDDNMLQLILLVQDYDLVHFFWRQILFNLSDKSYEFVRNDINVKEFLKEKFSKVAKTTCVPDQLLLDKENIEKNKDAINFVDNYYVISEKIYDIYNDLNGYNKPYGIICNGVETNKFKPKNLKKKFENIHNRKLVIGWSGNSKFGGNEAEDLKGVKTIIIPAIEELKKEGYQIELKLADRNEKLIPIEEMPEYYNSLDLYVCASKTEGGPNPVIESMACGVPVISTDVGFVKTVFGEKQKDYILKERSVEALKSNIKYLYNNVELLKELSEENLVQAKKYDYDNIKWEFKKFFDDTLNKKKGK